MRIINAVIIILLLAAVVFAQTLGGGAKLGGTAKLNRAGAGSTFFVEDTFTDGGAPLNLDTHTGETGATWTYHPNYTGSGGQMVVNTSGRMRATEGANMAYASGTPPSANYTVIGEGFYVGDPSLQRIAVVGRASTSTGDWYGVEYFFSTGEVSLIKNTAGTLTQLGTAVSITLTASDLIDLKLGMVGTTIVGYYQKAGGGYVLIDSVTDSTHTAAGKAGIYSRSFAGANLGIEFTHFTAQ